MISTITAVRNSRIDAVNTTITRNRTDRCEWVPPVANKPTVSIARPAKTTGTNRRAGILAHGNTQHSTPLAQASTVTTHSVV